MELVDQCGLRRLGAIAFGERFFKLAQIESQLECSVAVDKAGEIVIVIRDPGTGFDPTCVAHPLDPANMLKPSGRGIFLINNLMDEVRFADGGRELQMRKKKG